MSAKLGSPRVAPAACTRVSATATEAWLMANAVTTVSASVRVESLRDSEVMTHLLMESMCRV